MRSVAGYSIGLSLGIINTPYALWNTILHPISTICSIPENLQQTWGYLIGSDPFMSGYAIGSITAGIETSLAMGYVGKTLRTHFSNRIPKTELSNFDNILLADKISQNFSGRIHQRILQSDVTAYRYWGGVSDEFGYWLTTAKTVSKIESTGISAEIALKLPGGATAENLTSFVIPKGTNIFVGRVKDGASWATQIWVEDSRLLILE